MVDRLGVPAVQAGVIFLFFIPGIFPIGSFHAYLVDTYERKYVYIFAAILMVMITIGYAFIVSLTELILSGTVQRLAFDIRTAVGITLVIDITNSTPYSTRSASSSWTACMRMVTDIVFGI